MTEQSRMLAVVGVFALVVGLLTWAVVGPSHRRRVNVLLGGRLTQAQVHKIDAAFPEIADACEAGGFSYSPLTPNPDRAIAKRTVHGPVDGTVVAWHDESGWGVLASPSVQGRVWTFFSNINMKGYRTLKRGQTVRFTYETPGQDGYPHRAVSVRPRQGESATTLP
jgi:CspA family cold shock protein